MDFPSVLHDVSKLNSWAKVHDWGIPKYAIYWLKNEAIKKAISLNLCSHKKVFVSARCRDCGGSGRYEDSYGYKYDHCRVCNSEGIVRLRFVETSIQVNGFHQITWHTPWDKANFEHKLEWEGAWFMPAEDWTINKPGQPLSPIEAARILNSMEVYFKAGPRVCTWIHPYDDFSSIIDHFNYSLHLGSKARVCSICGESKKEEIQCGFGANKVKFHWTDFACKSCARRDNLWDLFEPPEVSKDPEIIIWEARHMAWFPKKET